jgi:PTS system ascorbate-specific IIA component
MSVGVLLVTHGRIGHELLAAASYILGGCPTSALALAVGAGADPDVLAAEARAGARQVDAGDGVLILTDLFGATPCNIAACLCDGGRHRVLSGVNLPMLLRVFNYHQLPLDALVAKATSGGHDGVVACAGPGLGPAQVAGGGTVDTKSAGAASSRPSSNRPATPPAAASAAWQAEPLDRLAAKSRVGG